MSKEDRRDVGRFLFLIDAYLKTLLTTKGRMLLDRVARLGHCIPKILQASSICSLSTGKFQDLRQQDSSYPC